MEKLNVMNSQIGFNPACKRKWRVDITSTLVAIDGNNEEKQMKHY